MRSNMRKPISDMTPEECSDEQVFGIFKRLLEKARKKQIEATAATALVFEALEDMCIDAFFVKTDAENADNLHEAIAAYEDTGLTPEEIHELTHSSSGPLHKKLGEWIDAEHDGRLRILPCKFGIKLWRAELDGTVRQYMVTAVNAQDRKHRRTLVECNPFTRFIWEEDFGKQFFLTMKDAEAELERRKHEAHL